MGSATPPQPALQAGARARHMDSQPCWPRFDGLKADEQRIGYRFATLWPAVDVVAHPDCIRAVRIARTWPERRRLIAEWYFLPQTLAQPGFDDAKFAGFATVVIRQDAGASEMDQRGIGSPAFRAARLMPEDDEIKRWICAEMEGTL